jgi:large subunit ribosomal protein L9
MEVILRQAVENVGHPGDIVKVSDGFGRNYLLPRGLAYPATDGYRKRIEQERQRLETAESARRDSAQGEEGKLFGSVTASDIAHQLEAQGYVIEKRQVDLHEAIRALGVYRVPIRLHADVRPEIKVWVIKA